MTWFSFPSVTDMVTNTASQSGTLVTQLLPLFWLILIFVVGVAAYRFVQRTAVKAIHQATRTGGRRRGRGRRR